jgi:hypothetical protein
MGLSERLHVFFHVLRRIWKKVGTQHFTLHGRCSVRASFTWVVLRAQNTVEEPSAPSYAARHNWIYKVHRVARLHSTKTSCVYETHF